MRLFIAILGLFVSIIAQANIVTPMYSTDGKHTFLGNVTFSASPYGLMIYPDLQNLSPGMHGLHIHVNPSCDNAGMAAGGHLDPESTGKHLGPYSSGHLGDLPVLYVNQAGIAETPTLAPRLTLEQIQHHALMIHQYGDNYADTPKALGGGGARIACGIISP